MLRAKRADGLNKFQRYRRMQHGRGMKLVRVWVPDPRNAEFQAEAKRQAALLHGAPEDVEALSFIEAAMDWPEA